MSISDSEAIEQKILEIARERFDWIGAPTPDADFRYALDLDSLHLVELQVAVEDHFGVVFDPLDEQLVDAFTSARRLAAYVHYLAKRGV